MTFYGTFDLNNHIGIEGNVHLASLFKSYYDYKENSFDAGVRWAWHCRRFTPYAKGLVGFGHASAPVPYQIEGAARQEPTSCLVSAVGWTTASLRRSTSAPISNISAGRTSHLTV